METSFRRQEYGFKRNKELVKEKSPLHQIEWHRIVLDEVNFFEIVTRTSTFIFVYFQGT
jgi:DNA repair protein RAD16